MKIGHCLGILILSLSLPLSACSSEHKKEEQKFGAVEIIPEGVAPRPITPTKAEPQAVSNPLHSKEALAKMSPEARRVVEEANEMRRKRLANEPQGPSSQPKPYKF